MWRCGQRINRSLAPVWDCRSHSHCMGVVAVKNACRCVAIRIEAPYKQKKMQVIPDINSCRPLAAAMCLFYAQALKIDVPKIERVGKLRILACEKKQIMYDVYTYENVTNCHIRSWRCYWFVKDVLKDNERKSIKGKSSEIFPEPKMQEKGGAEAPPCLLHINRVNGFTRRIRG